MAEHPNAVIARKLADAFQSGDMQAMGAMIADDIVWHEIGRSEPLRGMAALAANGAGAAEYKITTVLHDIVANDDHTIVLVDVTATHHGETLNYRTAEIYHMRDGKIAERWAFSDDTAAITAFFG